MGWTAPRDWTDGEFVTESILDTHIRDNLLALGPHLIVRKPSDESVTSSTALQADNDLILPVGASDVWLSKWYVLVTGATTGDFQLRFTYPASGILAGMGLFVSTAGAVTGIGFGDAASPTGATTVNLDASVGNLGVFDLQYTGGGTSGNVTLEWAQGASDATPTTVKANSTLWGYKIA